VNSAVKPKKLPLPKQSTIRNIHDTLTRSHPILEGDYQNSTSSKIANQHIQNPSASTEPPYQATITITLRHPSKNHSTLSNVLLTAPVSELRLKNRRSELLPGSESLYTPRLHHHHRSIITPIPVLNIQCHHSSFNIQTGAGRLSTNATCTEIHARHKQG
jgi:hypothetical protein